MERPAQCRHPDKSWLTKIQAMRKAEQYQMNWYRCYDHFHIGKRGKNHRKDQPSSKG